MTGTMYDGTNGDATAIAHSFPDAPMVAGYVDGLYVWSTAQWGLFPKAAKIRISAIPGSAEALTADVADEERGDYTIDQAVAWVHAKKAAGYDRPTVYCDRNDAPAVRVATGSLVLGVDYDLWVADYTGSAHEIVFPDGRKAAATQWQSFPTYDITAVYDSGWPHRKPPVQSTGPYRHVVPAGDTRSLHKIAEDRHVTEQSLIAVSLANLGPENTAVLNAYVAYENACAAAHITRPAMTPGMIYWTANP